VNKRVGIRVAMGMMSICVIGKKKEKKKEKISKKMFHVLGFLMD